MSLDDIIGVNDAAKLLQLSPGTVKNLCAEGRLPAKKIGKTWVLDKSKLKIKDQKNR
ncbi:helix-turn-helix domain-containing protein [Heyndrickxia ginsengihumi]|uniref:helix-turn-helix domain-containing protein n=1 Tax=Heyndrickxia ginsengihumi TaxID=363870 RepID=UPI00046E6B2E|nr:helix-turn-helix domain-containing protein [Heyndrickxia ginsengihumi]MCM3024613.1 helix-turn-helix domain-containing protein [Heyndrickxia ginsengihumi]